MIDGIPNRPRYFYQKDIIGYYVDTMLAKQKTGDFHVWPRPPGRTNGGPP